MNYYQKMDISGRTIFTQKLIKNGSTEITTTPLDCEVDILWTKNNTDYVGELKCREKYSSTSLNSGLIMMHKYFNVLKYAKDTNRIPYYVMMFNDDVGYIWRLDNLKLNWKYRYLEDNNTGECKTKRKRWCAEIPFEDGIRFSFRSFPVTIDDNDIS